MLRSITKQSLDVHLNDERGLEDLICSKDILISPYLRQSLEYSGRCAIFCSIIVGSIMGLTSYTFTSHYHTLRLIPLKLEISCDLYTIIVY